MHSKPQIPQINGLIEQANTVLKNKIHSYIMDNNTNEWWPALQEAILSMNLQVHSVTKESPYIVVFKQPIPDKRKFNSVQCVTATVIERFHEQGGIILSDLGNNNSILESDTTPLLLLN